MSDNLYISILCSILVLLDILKEDTELQTCVHVYSVFCVLVAKQSLFIRADYGKSYAAIVCKREWSPGLPPFRVPHLAREIGLMSWTEEYRSLTDAIMRA